MPVRVACRAIPTSVARRRSTLATLMQSDNTPFLQVGNAHLGEPFLNQAVEGRRFPAWRVQRRPVDGSGKLPA